MTRNRKRTTRLIAAAALVVPASLASVATSSATPKENLEAGQSKARGDRSTSSRCSPSRSTPPRPSSTRWRSAARRRQHARRRPSGSPPRRASCSRTGPSPPTSGAGSQLEGLLGAEDFNDFSDRLQYAGELAQNDADLAAKADAAGERAQWAAEQYASVAAEQKKAIEALGEQEARFRAQLEAAEGQGRGARAGLPAVAAGTAGGRGGGRGGGARRPRPTSRAAIRGTGYNPNPPNPNWGAARIAVEAAREQIGVTYVWGASTPGVAFDCSGLTMYAWGQAGVSLPHSSAMQAAVTPDVSREQLQEGDLVFFYNPISHVAIYSGNGMMVDASHPGPGGEVDEGPVNWDSFVVGGRPG